MFRWNSHWSSSMWLFEKLMQYLMFLKTKQAQWWKIWGFYFVNQRMTHHIRAWNLCRLPIIRNLSQVLTPKTNHLFMLNNFYYSGRKLQKDFLLILFQKVFFALKKHHLSLLGWKWCELHHAVMITWQLKYVRNVKVLKNREWIKDDSWKENMLISYGNPGWGPV